MHCLRQIVTGLMDHNHPEANAHHLGHCFTYLRQTFQCAASSYLEEGDFMASVLEGDFSPVGATMLCRDWEKLHAHMRTNFDEFVEWKKEWL